MFDGLALLVDRLGLAACTWVQAVMPSLGPQAWSPAIRLTTAMGMLVLSAAVAWALLAGIGRLLRLIAPPWQEATRAMLPSLRLVAVVMVAVASLTPFLWPVPLDAETSIALLPNTAPNTAPTASLAALITLWLASAITIIALGNLLFRVVHATGVVAMQRAKHTISAWDDVLIEVGVRVLLGFVILGTIYMAVAVLADHPVLTETTSHLLGLLVISLISWALINLVHLLDRFLMTRYRMESADNLLARRVATQVVVLKRLAYVVIAIFSISTALMQFDAIRHIGASILASAGLAGIVLGFAAQKTLGNLLAGMQIAVTQPLRIDDAVILENEFGRVEEINLTYVVICLWDQRRLIVPVSRIIETPFQNWSRTSTALLGTVMLRCDYRIAIAGLREEARRYVEGHRLWDRRSFALQVTDCDHRTIEVRVLVSAAAAGPLFDLRCEVREHLLAWLSRAHPEALPHLALTRPELQSPMLAGSAGA